jgi:site-specific recombinase XerC
MIDDALRCDPSSVIPDQFMLYCRYGWKLGMYQDTALDNLIKSAARRAEIDEDQVSNHVLRCSGARMIFHSGVDMTEISKMHGHADTRMTMIYLSLTVDDLAKAQEKRDDYLDLVRMKAKANPDAIINVASTNLIVR